MTLTLVSVPTIPLSRPPVDDELKQAVFHYPVPSHRQPAVEGLGAPALPQTERLVDEILTLPISSGHTDDEINRVATAVRDFFTR